jgi:hypothetical protein
MLHTWTAEGGYYLERPTTENDGADTAAPPRPPAGTVLLVRDNFGADLPSTTSTEGGYWTYSADFDGNAYGISLSSDGGVTWSPTLWSLQSESNAVNAGDAAASALSTAQAAQSTANEALGLAQSEGARSVNGVTPDETGNVTLTAANVGAVALGGTFPANQVTGLAAVAKSGSFNDLVDRPPIAIPLTQKGIANGVATLGADGLIPAAQLPGGGTGTGTVQSVNTIGPDANGNITLTAADVDARALADPVPAADVSGLAAVATSGALADLLGSISATQLLAGLPVRVFYDGSAWPARPTSRTDISVDWIAATAADPAPSGFIEGRDFLWKPAS